MPRKWRTVFPFSPRAYDRGLGPVAVSILRNGSYVKGVRINPEWATSFNSDPKHAVVLGDARLFLKVLHNQ
jgi:hypothetical protein